VVGAEDVDHVQEAARELVIVIGDIACEVRVAAVRLLQRAVFIVAERGRLEERLRPVFPLVVVVTLGLFELAFVDEALGAQHIDRRLHLVGAGLRQ